MPEVLVTFHGAVSCRSTLEAPGLALAGRTAEPGDGEVSLAFNVTSPVQCPETLEDALIERLGAGHYRLRSGAREWLIGARAVHLHRDIAPAFYRAIPPRPAPLGRRLMWRIVLALARSRPGLAALRALRR